VARRGAEQAGDGAGGRVAEAPQPERRPAVELHGAHDLRHTYATWLEDAGIPARVINELMGHQASSRGHLRGESR
jgi:integrase